MGMRAAVATLGLGVGPPLYYGEGGRCCHAEMERGGGRQVAAEEKRRELVWRLFVFARFPLFYSYWAGDELVGLMGQG